MRVPEISAVCFLVSQFRLLASLVPSPSFLALECAGSKKVGPGIHCLRMRYKNLMNLIIKSSRDANLRHTHKHSTVLCLELVCRAGPGLYSV